MMRKLIERLLAIFTGPQPAETLKPEKPSMDEQPAKTQGQIEWPPYINRAFAEQDGRTLEDFDFHQWPVSDVRLTHPAYETPREIALCYHCQIPADTPEANKYDYMNQPIPDPVGMTLSRVKFQMVDAGTHEVLDEDLRGHDAGTVQGFAPAGEDNQLWKRLVPGSTLRVQIAAFPLFYYLNEDGGAILGYAIGNNQHFKGHTCYSPVYTLAMDENGIISIDGQTPPPPPEITHEGLAEYEALVAKEKAEQERIERELHERLEREEEEREARWAREDAEREEERKRHIAEAEAERKRNEPYIQNRKKRTQVEEYMDVLADHYDAQFRGLLPDGDAQFRDFLLNQAKPLGGDWAVAADKVAAEWGWTL